RRWRSRPCGAACPSRGSFIACLRRLPSASLLKPKSRVGRRSSRTTRLSLLTRGLNTLAACPLHSDRSQIEADFAQTLVKCGQGAADRHPSRLLRARRERPRGRAAECRQQFPPSDGDCHTPLPCEVRKRERYHATSVLSLTARTRSGRDARRAQAAT